MLQCCRQGPRAPRRRLAPVVCRPIQQRCSTANPGGDGAAMLPPQRSSPRQYPKAVAWAPRCPGTPVQPRRSQRMEARDGPVMVGSAVLRSGRASRGGPTSPRSSRDEERLGCATPRTAGPLLRCPSEAAEGISVAPQDSHGYLSPPRAREREGRQRYQTPTRGDYDAPYSLTKTHVSRLAPAVAAKGSRCSSQKGSRSMSNCLAASTATRAVNQLIHSASRVSSDGSRLGIRATAIDSDPSKSPSILPVG